jgi:hypothetical protein
MMMCESTVEGIETTVMATEAASCGTFAALISWHLLTRVPIIIAALALITTDD